MMRENKKPMTSKYVPVFRLETNTVREFSWDFRGIIVLTTARMTFKYIFIIKWGKKSI